MPPVRCGALREPSRPRRLAVEVFLAVQLHQVLYPGVPVEEFGGLPDRKEARTQLNLNDDDNVLLFVGRLAIQHKGLDVLLHSLSSLRARGAPFVMLVVGPGEEAETLKPMARNLGIADAVRFLGRWSHPEIFVPLAASDVFVHPSRSEGLGRSMIEASLAGLPVVATTVGGIPEVVENEATGLLVPPGDSVALADAIQWMLEHPAERKHMGEAGRQLAQERFDLRKWAARLAEIYRELASSLPCGP